MEPIVIRGLLESHTIEGQYKVRLLGDIPIFCELFKNTSTKTDLVVIIPEPVGRGLEPEELATLLMVWADLTMELYFRVLLDTGLRRGEGLALTWAASASPGGWNTSGFTTCATPTP